MLSAAAAADTADHIRTLLAASNNLAAVEMARSALNREDGPAELLYLYALSCARCGARDAAVQAIERLRGAAAMSSALRADVESLAGRLAKDQFLAARDPKARALALTDAIAAYREADRLHPNVHARINAASLLRMADAEVQACALARGILLELDHHGQNQSHWESATRGEAALLIGDGAAATAYYRDACRLAGRRFGDIASMRRQLAFLALKIPDANLALEQIPGPQLIAFSGHMIDTDDRGMERFPAWLEGPVRDALDRKVAASLPAIGYSQAACGSDILFCEAMAAHGQEINIVLPFAREDYVAQSVLPGGTAWAARFDRVLASAASVIFATEGPYFGDDTLFEHSSDLILGLTLLRADQLAVQPRVLTVADCSQPGSTGGTWATQMAWADRIETVDLIDLAAIRSASSALRKQPDCDSTPRRRPAPKLSAGGARTIRSLLFADVKGFGSLAEEYFPTFFATFRGFVPKIVSEQGVEPLEVSSSGDGLYAVFATPQAAARFAQKLSAEMAAVDWQTMGMPADTHVRIALHTGPVFSGVDPMTRKLSYYGAQVTRTARVEPVVIPGQILVTEPFAAVLATVPNSMLACDLVGTQPLAKGFGSARLYRLRERW